MTIRISRYHAIVARGVKTNIGDTLSFIDDGDFVKQFFDECGLTNEDYDAIQIAITATPDDGDVVPVSKSIRDLFYVIDESTTVTIRYAHLASANTVILIAAYFGDQISPMSEHGARMADKYVDRQLTYFSAWHTR